MVTAVQEVECFEGEGSKALNGTDNEFSLLGVLKIKLTGYAMAERKLINARPKNLVTGKIRIC